MFAWSRRPCCFAVCYTRCVALIAANAPPFRHAGMAYFLQAPVGYHGGRNRVASKIRACFLGHPNYARLVVLAGLLRATGMGALCFGHPSSAAGRPRFKLRLRAPRNRRMFWSSKLEPRPLDIFPAPVLIVLALIMRFGVPYGYLCAHFG